MPSYFDLAVLAIVLVSALLSMVRGFTREVLAIASWGAAFAAAYFFYPEVVPYLRDYIHKDALAITAAVALIFFVTLVLVSIITVRLSDAILDSKVGPLDRTLGFIFGAARGFALGVIAFLLFNYLVPKNQPEWVASAKTRPLLQSTGDELIALLPDHLASSIVKVIQHPKADDVPADEGETKDISPNPTLDGNTPAKKAETGTRQPVAPTQTDKQKLENLLSKGGAATPAPPAKRP